MILTKKRLKSALAESEKLSSAVDSSLKEYEEKQREFEERKKCCDKLQVTKNKYSETIFEII